MGAANLFYVILALLTVVGLGGFIYSKLAGRPRRGPAMFVLFLVGLVGILFWGIFLANLKDTLAETIRDGQYQQRNYEQERLAAEYQHLPPPPPSEVAQQAFAAMKNAKRSARFFGWDWKKLEPSYAKGRVPPKGLTKARPPAQPSNR
jgi:hypothetical protein